MPYNNNPDELNFPSYFTAIGMLIGLCGVLLATEYGAFDNLLQNYSKGVSYAVAIVASLIIITSCTYLGYVADKGICNYLADKGTYNASTPVAKQTKLQELSLPKPS